MLHLYILYFLYLLKNDFNIGMLLHFIVYTNTVILFYNASYSVTWATEPFFGDFF